MQLWRAPAEGYHASEVRELVSNDRSSVTCAEFTPDGKFMVTGNRDGQVMLWRVPTAEELSRQVEGRVSLVEGMVEASSTPQVRIWAELNNPDGRLIPGTNVTLVIYPDDKLAQNPDAPPAEPAPEKIAAPLKAAAPEAKGQ